MLVWMILFWKIDKTERKRDKREVKPTEQSALKRIIEEMIIEIDKEEEETITIEIINVDRGLRTDFKIKEMFKKIEVTLFWSKDSLLMFPHKTYLYKIINLETLKRQKDL